MMLLIVGYASGTINKLLYSYDWVIYLYILNLVLVSIDLSLYYKYKNNGPCIDKFGSS